MSVAAYNYDRAALRDAAAHVVRLRLPEVDDVVGGSSSIREITIAFYV